jgi:hypothetical protein
MRTGFFFIGDRIASLSFINPMNYDGLLSIQTPMKKGSCKKLQEP